MKGKATMETRSFKIGLAVLALAAWAGPARAQTPTNTWATASGNWGTASIWTTNTVPGSGNDVYIGASTGAPGNAALTATVTLTANESAADVFLGYGNTSSGTLALGSNALTVSGNINIGIVGNGGTGSITEGAGGSFTAAGLNIYSTSVASSINSYTFGSKDVVGSLLVNGPSTATTVATGNVTGNAYVEAGGTLNLGAAMNFYGGGVVDVEGPGSVLNMNGHSIGANAVELGYNGSSAVTIQNQGTISTGNLLMGNSTSLTLGSSDQASDLTLTTKSTLTTSATGNLGGNVSVLSGSTLNMGAAISAIGNVSVQDAGSAINANGHGITSQNLYVGWYGSSAASLTNAGPVTTNDLYVGNGSALTLHGGDTVNSLIDLKGGSTLTVQEVGGTGLTLSGTSLSSLTIDPSQMDLIFTPSSTPNWDFRWQDPTGGGNWISTIDGLIAGGQIQITAPNGYSVVDNGGYTYIDGTPQGIVPEPSSVIMLSLGALGVLGMMAARRRRAG